MILKISSWNVWGGKYLPKIIDYIQDSKPDIIGLQEVVQDLDGTNNTALIIGKKLGYECAYYSVDKTDFYGAPQEWGNAVLSKHKIIRHRVYNLSRDENRIVVEADIKVGNKVLSVFCTHLLHTHQKPSKVQEEQAESLVRILPKRHTILMGDFNATLDSNAIKIISSSIRNVDEQNQATWSIYTEGCKMCNPSGLLNETLDYFFVTEDIKVRSFKGGNSKGSDHLPILAIIEI